MRPPNKRLPAKAQCKAQAVDGKSVLNLRALPTKYRKQVFIDEGCCFLFVDSVCGKRVRWSSLGRRPTHLARHDTAKLAGTLSTQFLAGKALLFALPTAMPK